jgi:HAD superfamily phosphoserine phosphatase-like hydrolase
MRDEAAVVRVKVEALCKRLDESLRAGALGAVASDGDGTLWTGDIGDALFDAVVDEGGLRDEVRGPLARELEALGLEAAGDANALARSLRQQFLDGRLGGDRYFALQSWSYAGWREDELAQKCGAVLDAFGFEAAVRPEMRRVVAWCRERGVPFYLVSASPEPIVLQSASRLGIDGAQVLAMRAASSGGVVLPALAAAPTYGSGKVARLAEELSEAPLLAAFGDNTWDAAMLERAAYPVMVAPRAGLREALAGFDGVFELEVA